MESVPHNVGVRGGGCGFFFDDREAGFDFPFRGEAILPLDFDLLLEDFGLLIGIENKFCHE
jgi:hypothetical protein